MWPYVLVGAIAKLAIAAAGYWYTVATGNEPPLNSTVGTVIQLLPGLAWYAKKINRPMQRSELIWFSIGTVFVDSILSVILLFGFILIHGRNISVQNIDFALGGNGSTLISGNYFPIVFLMLFTTLLTFSFSMFIAWIATRKLPRRTTER